MSLNRKDRLALIIAGMSLFGTVSSAVIMAHSAGAGDPQTSETCIVLFGEYQKQIAANPLQKRIIVQHVLPSDPDAKHCHLTPTDFP